MSAAWRSRVEADPGVVAVALPLLFSPGGLVSVPWIRFTAKCTDLSSLLEAAVGAAAGVAAATVAVASPLLLLRGGRGGGSIGSPESKFANA